MATNWTPAEEKLLSACRETLDSIIRRLSTDREIVYPKDEPVPTVGYPIQMKKEVRVDRAVAEMWLTLLRRNDDVLGAITDERLVNLDRVERQVLHDAVDICFRIYRGRRRGRPPSDQSEVRRMVEMKQAGKTYRQIARAFGYDTEKDKSKDLVRQRIKKARSQGGKNSES